jgi:hypothetical protein
MEKIVAQDTEQPVKLLELALLFLPMASGGGAVTRGINFGSSLALIFSFIFLTVAVDAVGVDASATAGFGNRLM